MAQKRVKVGVFGIVDSHEKRCCRNCIMVCVALLFSPIVAMGQKKAMPCVVYGWDEPQCEFKPCTSLVCKKLKRLEISYHSLKKELLVVDESARDSSFWQLKKLIDFLKSEQAYRRGKMAVFLYQGVTEEFEYCRKWSVSAKSFDRHEQRVKRLLSEVMPQLCPVAVATPMKIEVDASSWFLTKK